MAEEHPELIHAEIDATRESLATKLESLEGQVKEAVGTVTDTIETVKQTVENTVESVKTGVESTVESVKTTLNDTVDSVKQAFDIAGQIDNHPWAAVGCAMLAGMTAGYLWAGRSRPGHASTWQPAAQPMHNQTPANSFTHAGPQTNTPAQPSFFSGLFDSFEGELKKVREVALGALIGVARDALKDALPPSLQPQVAEIMDSATRTVGGKPVQGPVLQTA
jgi:ElaB/YqjD/DUF883 family membrane-anchored ribosome-binding protein